MTTTTINPITVAQVRAAIADVIDGGDMRYQKGTLGRSWTFLVNDESEQETEARVRFMDAVTAELRRLEGQ